MFTFDDIITLAVQIEKNGEMLYRDVSKKVSDASFASFLKWMADEEKKHKEWFLTLGKRVSPSVQSRELEMMGKELLRTAMGGGLFSLNAREMLSADTMDEMIVLSMEVEDDTILFYELLQTFIDDEKVALELEAIIREEKNHKQKLNTFLMKAS